MILEKPSVRFELIQSILADNQNLLTVSELCELAGVSRSGYYRWLNAEESRQAREASDRRDFEYILEAYRHRGYQKGTRSIHMTLLHRDPPVVMNVKKIRRLMKKYGLVCSIRSANPYRRIAKALRTSNVSENLLNREFKEHGPRMVLLTDITYLPYHGTFAYLSTILDAFIRQVLAYVISPSLQIDFVLETVNLLLRDHGTELQTDTLIHSDQGCHYTSYRYIDLLRDSSLRQSMSRKGNCWDNAPQESFFGHMKDEIDLSACISFNDVKVIIDDWMDYYNNERYQWSLARLSPNEYYRFLMTREYPLSAEHTPAVSVFDSGSDS